MPFRLFIASGCVKAWFGFAACTEKRRPLSHTKGFQRYRSELVFTADPPFKWKNSVRAEPNTDSMLHILWVSLSCPAFKSVRLTGHECQGYFVNLTCILSLLKYKGDPRLQEVAGLLWFALASTSQLNPNEKSGVTEMLGSPKQPFNLSL